MFRFLRPSKSFLSVSRLPIRVESRTARGEVSYVQNVRFQKRRLRPRSLAISVLTVYTCYWAWSKLTVEPVLDAVIDAAGDVDPKAEAPPLFIPLPGTTKSLPPRRYQTNDPEYQAYVKFLLSKDQQQVAEEELAHVVLSLLQKHPFIKAKFGTNLFISGFWLNPSCPSNAPPVLVRTGIEIADDYIALVTQPVKPETEFIIRRALWPSAMAMSLWSFAKVVVMDDIKNVARIIGLETSEKPPTIQDLLSGQQQQQQQQMAKLPAPGRTQPLGDTQAQKSGVLARDVSSPSKRASTQEEPSASQAKKADPTESKLLSQSMAAFVSTLQKSWKPVPYFLPKGNVLYEGIVEIEASNAWIVFNVRAYWDLKTNSYDPRSLSIRVAHVHPKGRGPLRRGPSVLR